MFKEDIKSTIISSMEELNANVAMAMIYGDTTDLDESIQEDFKAIGVSHLMSVSGTHIISFMMIINTILGIKKKNKNRNNKKLRNKKNKRNIIKQILQIFSIAIYIVFTGFGLSVVRAGIMLTISIFCDMLGKEKNKYYGILITLLIMVFLNPYIIFNTGARLSFIATLGIIVFGKHIAKIFEKITNKIKNNKLQKLAEYIAQNIAITISVQLLIIPIQIQAFNKLPFPVIFPNLILGIITTPLIVIGTIGIMLSFIPPLSISLFSLVELILEALIYLVQIFKNISFSISTVSLPLIFFVLYYLLVISIFIYFKLKGVQNKEGKYNIKRLLKYLRVFGIVLLIILITMVIVLNIYSIYLSEYVYFFNVEQGDMSYIKCGSSSVIVDIGSLRDNLSYNVISNYFKFSNLNKVDAVIISHMHKDHINGLEDFVRNYSVGMVIYAKPKEESTAFNEFKEILERYNITSKQVKQGDVINIGKIKIEVLLPGENYIDSADQVNANSLVCKITAKDKQMLYMGDASKEAEEKLIRNSVEMQNIDILKVGHHGSQTATSEAFIQMVKPQNAVISALKKYYGHPHENTISILKNHNVYTYLTEKQGAIKFMLN